MVDTRHGVRRHEQVSGVQVGVAAARPPSAYGIPVHDRGGRLVGARSRCSLPSPRCRAARRAARGATWADSTSKRSRSPSSSAPLCGSRRKMASTPTTTVADPQRQARGDRRVAARSTDRRPPGARTGGPSRRPRRSTPLPTSTASKRNAAMPDAATSVMWPLRGVGLEQRHLLGAHQVRDDLLHRRHDRRPIGGAVQAVDRHVEASPGRSPAARRARLSGVSCSRSRSFSRQRLLQRTPSVCADIVVLLAEQVADLRQQLGAVNGLGHVVVAAHLVAALDVVAARRAWSP